MNKKEGYFTQYGWSVWNGEEIAKNNADELNRRWREIHTEGYPYLAVKGTIYKGLIGDDGHVDIDYGLVEIEAGSIAQEIIQMRTGGL